MLFNHRPFTVNVTQKSIQSIPSIPSALGYSIDSPVSPKRHTPQSAGVPLPFDDYEVDSTTGFFRVSEGGGAVYTIPVMTVQGVGAVTPQISLVYNSHAGNGMLGMGGSIGGLSTITRCRKTLGQDREAQAVNFSKQDRFCLDGQRLVLERDSNGNPKIGANGRESYYGEPGSTYRTEIDSHARITIIGDSSGEPDFLKLRIKMVQFLSTAMALSPSNAITARFLAGQSINFPIVLAIR